MGNLNQTPSANRLHISFFGCRNAGKSSVVNAITGQELSIVSDIKGTTTDPVTKSMELRLSDRLSLLTPQALTMWESWEKSGYSGPKEF